MTPEQGFYLSMLVFALLSLAVIVGFRGAR